MLATKARYEVVKTQDSFGHPMFGVVVIASIGNRQMADTIEIFEDPKNANHLARQLNRSYKAFADFCEERLVGRSG